VAPHDREGWWTGEIRGELRDARRLQGHWRGDGCAARPRRDRAHAPAGHLREGL